MILTNFGFAAAVADISEAFIGLLEYGNSSGLSRSEVLAFRAWLRDICASLGRDRENILVTSHFVVGLEGNCEITGKYARLIRVAFIAGEDHLDVEYFTFNVDSSADPGDLTVPEIVNSAIAAAVAAGYIMADPYSVDDFRAFLSEHCGAV